MSEKSWLDRKNELDEELKQSYRRCTPMIVATIIAAIGVFMFPIPENSTSVYIFYGYLGFYWWLVYKTIRFLKLHNKIRKEWDEHTRQDPYK